MSRRYELSLPVAAARELHRHASLASVFAYDALADAWREVPTTRSWQSVRAFDWRPPSEAGGLGAMAHAAFDAAMATKLPPQRWGQKHMVRSAPVSSRTLFASADEVEMGEPHRCKHGRSHLGCLAGFGVQRDARTGRKLPIHGRIEPEVTEYPPVWFPPLAFVAAT